MNDPIVFVHGYHFFLTPKMIRERLPRAVVVALGYVLRPERIELP